MQKTPSGASSEARFFNVGSLNNLKKKIIGQDYRINRILFLIVIIKEAIKFYPVNPVILSENIYSLYFEYALSHFHQ